MIVCICANISDKKIKQCLSENNGIETVKELRQHLPVCNQCAKCKKDVCAIVEKHKETVNAVAVIE